MNKGFVTVVNQKYLELHSILIDSLLSFSSFPIEVFSLNFDYQHLDKRVKIRRINFENEANFHQICYAKIKGCLLSEFDKSVYIDSDAMANKDIDCLFENIDNNEKLIIGPRHPLDPDNQKNVMDFLSVKSKTQPYIHAASFLFTSNSKTFLKEVYDNCHLCHSNSVIPANQDETVLNCSLWKRGATDKFVKWFDPSPEFFLDFIKNGKELQHINYKICHGIKNVAHASEMLKKIKSK